MKKIYILAYCRTNLGDDIFIDMLVKRYNYIDFYINNLALNSSIFTENKNLHFINYNFEELTNLTDFDAFIFIGGSIFMEHAGGIERINKLKNLAIKCKKLKIPFYYISSNFGPYQTENYKIAVSELFGEITDICLRDKYSFNLFKNAPSVRYAPDAILSYNFDKCEIEKNTIGISVINFKFRNDLKIFEPQYYNLLINSINQYTKNGYIVKLFSFCEYEGDNDTCELIFNNISKKDFVKIVSYSGNIKEFLSEYSKVEYMICSRFHSMILSYLLNQKSYILSYSNKINNVITDLDLIDNYFTLQDICNIKSINLNDFKNFNIDHSILKNSETQFKKLDEFILDQKRD